MADRGIFRAASGCTGAISTPDAPRRGEFVQCLCRQGKRQVENTVQRKHGVFLLATQRAEIRSSPVVMPRFGTSKSRRNAKVHLFHERCYVTYCQASPVGG